MAKNGKNNNEMAENVEKVVDDERMLRKKLMMMQADDAKNGHKPPKTTKIDVNI